MNEEIENDFLKQVKLLRIKGVKTTTLIRSRINKDFAFYHIPSGKIHSYHPFIEQSKSKL